MFEGKIEWTVFPRINCLQLEGKLVKDKEFKNAKQSSERGQWGIGEMGVLTAMGLDIFKQSLRSLTMPCLNCSYCNCHSRLVNLNILWAKNSFQLCFCPSVERMWKWSLEKMTRELGRLIISEAKWGARISLFSATEQKQDTQPIRILKLIQNISQKWKREYREQIL